MRKTDNSGLEKEIIRRESVVAAAEAALLSREKLVTLRENAMQLREDNAASRKWEIHVTEDLEAKSAEQLHMQMLQQANSHLIIASIEAHQLAEQVEATKVQLQITKSEAERANQAKSDFLSNMSHELRTPLNSILGFAQLMEISSPPPTPTQAARIGQILKAGWYLLELINEILDLSSIESGKLSMTMESVSLPDVLRDCHAMLEPLAKENDIRISFPEFNLPCFIEADRTHLKQVLTNLLSNAIKYNCVGGTIEVSCETITTHRLRISVQDTGKGLSPEQLLQLFQPFNRLGQENSAIEGTGLGLVMCKRMIELMGGEIGVQGTVGIGCVFWFELNTTPASQSI